MATHSSILAWKIPWTEDPDRLQFMGSQRVGHDRITSLSLFKLVRASFIYLFLLIFTVKVKSLSHARLFATPWTVAYQAPPSVGFSRQEYWSGLPFPSHS